MIRAENLSGDAHYWLGRLSAALQVSERYPKEAQSVLQEFKRSPVCTKPLLDKLKEGTPK